MDFVERMRHPCPAMSSHSDDHSDSDAVEAHEGAHDHHGFDPEPVSEIADEEPRTPMWMPAVGVTLLVLFGLYLALGDDEAPTDETAPAMTTWAAPGNAAESPDGPDAKGPPTPSPAQVQQIQQKIQQFQAQQKGRAPGRPAQRPGARPGALPALRPGAPPAGRPAPPARRPAPDH